MRKRKSLIKSIWRLRFSNSFWMVVCWMLYESSQVLDPAWVESHPAVKTWLPVFVCMSGILYKVFQNVKKYGFTDNEDERGRV